MQLVKISDDGPTSKAPAPVPAHGTSGKLLVSYSLLRDLAGALGKARYRLLDSVQPGDLSSGSAEVDDLFKSFATTNQDYRSHLCDSLYQTGHTTEQAATDYQTADQALARK